jgi:spore photoproduct lyase-like protein
MLDIPARVVYVDPAIDDQPNCRERLERILPHVICDDVREYDAAAREEVKQIGSRRHGKDDFGDDAVVVFTTFDPARTGWYCHLRDAARVGENQNGQCQSAMELNIVEGCVFRCAYCGFGRALVFHLDLERWMEELPRLFAEHPTQRLFKYSNMTDLPPFEPEAGLVAPMVQRFATEPDRYLMLFTKSDNVDFLLDLDHNGHTIVSWSVSSDTVSREIDKRAATMTERIEAMRRCQQAGYIVRARLSPIVPVRNWREEYEQLFEQMFAVARPDMVTLELLGWFDFEDLSQLIDPALLDADAYAAAEATADELRDVNWSPFTEQTHIDVYRHCIETVKRLSPDTPVSVCHGTPRAWDELGSLMGMTPDNYICNCGPDSTPGGALYDRLCGA